MTYRVIRVATKRHLGVAGVIVAFIVRGIRVRLGFSFRVRGVIMFWR
jgi:hypothetical protein